MSAEQEMKASWMRLERQLQLLSPESWKSLLPGATDDIWEAENRLEVELPAEVNACYRLHNGQMGGASLVNGWVFSSLKRMCLQWGFMMNDLGSSQPFPCPTQEHAPFIWHRKWLPFLGFYGQMFCIDLAPGPKGKMGQILWYNDRYSDYPAPFSPTPFEPLPAIRVVAPNLQEFFAMLATDLETGRYVFDKATGLLWNEEFRSALPKILLNELKKAQGVPRRQSLEEEMSWDNPNLNEWLGRDY